jgi:hypothetical protein
VLAGDGPHAGRILVDHGAIAIGLGDDAGARRLADQAFDLSADQVDSIGMARAEALLGMLARRAGDPAEARRHLDAALVTLDDADRQATTDGRRPGRIATHARAARSRMGHVETAGKPLRDALAVATPGRHGRLPWRTTWPTCSMPRAEADPWNIPRAVAIFAEIGGRPGELQPEVWKLVEW